MNFAIAFIVSTASLFGIGNSATTSPTPLKYIVDNPGNGSASGENSAHCRFWC